MIDLIVKNAWSPPSYTIFSSAMKKSSTVKGEASLIVDRSTISVDVQMRIRITYTTWIDTHPILSSPPSSLSLILHLWVLLIIIIIIVPCQNYDGWWELIISVIIRMIRIASAFVYIGAANLAVSSRAFLEERSYHFWIDETIFFVLIQKATTQNKMKWFIC